MEPLSCVVIVILIAGVPIALLVMSSRDAADRHAEERAAQAAARRAYDDALRALVADPANPQLRTRALTLGRTYSNYTRNHQGVTLFDEVALMNDINAACAAALTARPAVSIEDRLTRLNELKTGGLISEAEYDERRREILRDV